MKKLLISFAAVVIFLAAAATNVYAEEYQVEKGDTLSYIAEEFDVSVDNLKSWNNLDSDLITVHQMLDIENQTSDNDTRDEVAQEDQVKSGEINSAEEKEENPSAD